MTAIIDILVGLIFLLTLITSYKEGLVKNTAAVISSLLGFFLAARSYSVLAGVLSFLPGNDWENFIGFFVIALLFNIVIGLILIPARAWYEKNLEDSFVTNLAGSFLGVINLAVGLTIFALSVKAYPVNTMLENIVYESGAFLELTDSFGFLRLLLGNFI